MVEDVEELEVMKEVSELEVEDVVVKRGVGTGRGACSILLWVIVVQVEDDVEVEVDDTTGATSIVLCTIVVVEE